ncbi:adenylate kinase family protein [Tenacibaculum caenipelagi]|uniref:Adenylate kinase n=1 Tax=Tenacibaculum caenipelagi TaxID=1325435 RepID=A0A4R6TGM5_9FLAO|nr:nucleoside monophosphate kinase [Tenacibaculum caenipelagi]TDQ25808.1 adenylate kinase [Tenacibaculum caenipelagi]
MNIIIFGPPLAGKGTQSKKIINDFNLTHLSTGDVLRNEKAKQSDLGLKAEEYSSKGLLVPDNLVMEIVESFYFNQKEKNNFLFDGYPRNIEQAEHLINFLEKDKNVIDLVIYLKVPKDVLLERAKIRAIEEDRKDDTNQNTVLTRIDEFVNLTAHAIDFIKKQGITTIEINGNQSVEEIYKIIYQKLNNLESEKS